MIVLALDTAGADCAACLYDSTSDRMLAKTVETIGRGHAERLMGMILEVMEQGGVTAGDINRVAVTIGPGSFTGIRVAVAAARGLALSPGVDAVGVTTLEVLAAQHLQDRTDSRPFMVAMDARRSEIFAQEFAADGSPASPPCVLTLEDARRIRAERPAGFVITGSAAALIVGEGEENARERGTGERGAEQRGNGDRFPIAIIARLGAAMPEGSPRPKPLYLRGPDAKPQEGFALARKAAV